MVFRYKLKVDLKIPLDFRKSNLDFPHYVGGVTGLSGITVVNDVPEGRFSDAIEAKRVTVWLSKSLPRKFTLLFKSRSSRAERQ